MIAVHLEQGRVDVVRRPKPRRRAGFALIRLMCGGICNTDLELQRGYYGFRGVPGHEFVGEVVEADNSSLVGRRVVGEINLTCGSCEWCRIGLGRHCPRRTVLGIVKHSGAFRELIDLPESNLWLVPRGVADDQAVFTEPLAAACEILDQVEVPRKEPVAVLGDGKLGLLVAQVLQVHGAQVHLFGRHPEKLAIAEHAGVSTALTTDKLPRSEYRLTVDATGSADGLRQAIAMTRPRGTVVMKSTVHGDVALDMAPIIVNEISLVGSRCGRFRPALRLLASRRINLKPMISARLPLSSAPEAFALAATKGVLKVLLTT